MEGFPHIAVVDDEQAIVDILGYSLRKTFPDVRITGFHQVDQAWAWLSRNTVDLVLTDLNMPELDGREIVSLMRKNAPHTPVVVISGAIPWTELKGLESEFSNVQVFAKPLLTRELLQGVRSGLGRKNVFSLRRQQQLSLPNRLHLLHLQESSVQVSVEHADGSGGVILVQGEPVLADFDGDQTEESFFKLCALDQPKITVNEGKFEGEVQITKSFEELFREYVRRRNDA